MAVPLFCGACPAVLLSPVFLLQRRMAEQVCVSRPLVLPHGVYLIAFLSPVLAMQRRMAGQASLTLHRTMPSMWGRLPVVRWHVAVQHSVSLSTTVSRPSISAWEVGSLLDLLFVDSTSLLH